MVRNNRSIPYFWTSQSYPPVHGIHSQRKEQKHYEVLLELTEKVAVQGGLWKSDEDVEAALKHIEDSGRGKSLGKQVEALKTQMMYRKQILKQVLQDSKLWCYSEQREGKPCMLKVPELAAHLKLIIKESQR
jgi:hypothetical protein